MKNILFICHGNICRSPMAEGLFRKLSAHHPEWQAGSAGTAAWPGQAASPETLHVLQAHGVNLSCHESRPVTEELMENATDVYAMTESHLAALLANFPEHADKVKLVTCYTGNRGIADPNGCGRGGDQVAPGRRHCRSGKGTNPAVYRRKEPTGEPKTTPLGPDRKLLFEAT